MANVELIEPVAPIVQDPTIGPDLILNRSDGHILLHTTTAEAPEEVGCFDNVADAWRALDKLDRAALARVAG